MISQKCNRVQDLKSKFETLNAEKNAKFIRIKSENYTARLKKEKLCKQFSEPTIGESTKSSSKNNACKVLAELNSNPSCSKYEFDETDSRFDFSASPEREICTNSLTRQSSDAGNKKLQRSHAFRRDRNQKSFCSKKHYSSDDKNVDILKSEKCNMDLKRSENNWKTNSNTDLTSQDRSNFLFVKENLRNVNCAKEENATSTKHKIEKLSLALENLSHNQNKDVIISKLDSDIPKHILDQYAKVIKNKKTEKNDSETHHSDSGVSSETEQSPELDQNPHLKRLISQFEDESTEMYASNETIRLERKNPHIKLTDTLKKALKQPLPVGPPPRKPPRILNNLNTSKKSPKMMLDKLQQVLEQRSEVTKTSENIYDIAELNESEQPNKKKDIHYMCTEILKLPQRSSPETNIALTLTKCFNSLNCGVVKCTNIERSSLSFSDDCLNAPPKRLSTFLQPETSKFYVDNEEHIYSEPFVEDIHDKNDVRQFNSLKLSQNGVKTKYLSLEDIRMDFEEKKIYDIPCEVSRTPSPVHDNDLGIINRTNLYGSLRKPTRSSLQPPAKREEHKLHRKRSNSFESATIWKRNIIHNKPKAVDLPRFEGAEQIPNPKKPPPNPKFSTDPCRGSRRLFDKNPKGNSATNHKGVKAKLNATYPPSVDNIKQLDIDKENLNKLMSEIYERVSTEMELKDDKPGKFPVNSEGDNTSEESVKLTRSMTEKRKKYVRRVSSIHNTRKCRLRHQTSLCSYNTDVPPPNVKSWRSYSVKPTQSTALDISPVAAIPDVVASERTDRLIDMCLFVNHDFDSPKLQWIYPYDANPPNMVETFIFPDETNLNVPSEYNQQYCIVLTNDIGERGYLYARRVLAEGTNVCLPAAYCLITKNWNCHFYYQVLKEIEQRHGYTKTALEEILKCLYESSYPEIDQSISVTFNQSIAIRLGDRKADLTRNSKLSDEGINETIVIKRTQTNYNAINVLIDCMGVSTAVKMFANLLLERKVIIMGDKLSEISSCIEAISYILYPFIWPHVLVSVIPKDILEHLIYAPTPLIGSMIKINDLQMIQEEFQEGILIDITKEGKNKIVFCCGDESSILPNRLYKTLKSYLQQIVKNTGPDTESRGLLLREGFQKFFEQILQNFQQYYKGDHEFDRDTFVSKCQNKQIQLFLEWFCETAMFDHFVQNVRKSHDVYGDFLNKVTSRDDDRNKGIMKGFNVWELFNK